ncbi:MAG TPA: YciI family protein [Streptosporangiaceae bacterium]|nr:YciI family protein [Streptosporangiaceae bacterium]
MALYAALLYYPQERYWLNPAEADTAPGYARFFEAAMAADVLRGGEALHPADAACTVTVAGGEGGDITIADGPRTRAADVLGGFYLIEASDDKEAASWAARIPAAWRGQVELRPVVPMQNKPGR